MKKIIFSLLTFLVIFNPSFVLAEELSITGNGDGSTNAVNITSTQSNEATQNNEAQVTNNVEVNANTGDNSASENTGGESNIATGDINSNVEIVNAGINQSTVEIGCCDDANTNIGVTGNGSGSNNNVGYSNNSTTNVNVNNNANIYNSIKGTANTGYNQARKNNGDVSIKTGSITVEDTIINRSINISSVKAENSAGGSVSIIIKNNGADSQNSVIVENENTIQIDVNNTANIVNESSWDLNTGNNEANKNNGDVEIESGDIVYKTTIENTDVNTNVVDVDCCEEKNPDGPDNPDPTPPTPGPGGSNGSSQGGTSSGNGSSNGGSTSSGPILPITGSPSLLVLAIAVTIMFFLGWYLRLHSGRAPNLAR